MNSVGKRFPLGLGATICGIGSLVGFMSTCGWTHIIGWLAVASFILGWTIRGRFNYRNRYAIVAILAICAASLLVGDRPALQTNFVSSHSMRLALATVCILGLFQCWRYSQIGQRVYCCLAVVSHMVSLVMMGSLYDCWPVAIQGLGVALLVSDERSTSLGLRQSKSKMLSKLAPMVVVSALALALVLLFRWSDSKVNWLMSLINVAPAGSLRFPDRSPLSRMSRSNENPQVLARYYADSPSLYLISRTYSTYQKSNWDSPKDFTTLIGQPQQELHRYQLTSNNSPNLIEEHIEVAESSPGPIFPRDAQTLDVEPSQLNRTFGDSYSYPKGASEAPIRFRRTSGSGRQVFEKNFGIDERSALLQVPESLKISLLEISNEWLAQSKLTPGDLSKEALAHRMENYLQNHYEYGFGYPFDNHYEPVLSFLKVKPPAHCELFAASLTLILRSHGIPARYVVGFLAREYNSHGGYATIRVRDAHAWVEAYFEGKGWVTLDATPSVARAAPQGATHWLEDLSDALHTFFEKIWTQNWKDSLYQGWRLFKPLIPLAILLFGVNYMLRMRLRSKRKPKKRILVPIQTLTLTDSESQALLKTVERAWAEAGFARPAHLTLHRWWERLQIELPEGSNEIGKFLCLYQQFRYGQAEVSPTMLHELIESAENAKSSVPTAPSSTQKS